MPVPAVYRSTHIEGARRLLARWQDDPVAFAREALGIRRLWSRQIEILQKVASGKRIAVRSGHKIGKLLHPETPIPTPSGWRRYGDLRVGDVLFSDTGDVCRVVGEVHWKDRPLYRITFEDGTWVDADERHEWVVHTRESRKRTEKPPVTVETREIAARLTVPNGRNADGSARRVPNFTIDLPGPVQCPTRALPLDPYLLGLWLGDGGTDSAVFTTNDDLWMAFSDAGFSVRAGRPMHYYVHGLIPVLRKVGVFGDKHVPHEYLWASAEQRFALLQGLMDTDGTVSARGRCQFANTNRRLADAVLHLARSLGIKARIRERRAVLRGRDCGPMWNVEWADPTPVFRLSRKAARVRSSWKQKASAHRRLAIVSAERLPGTVDSKCIEVDSPSHLYLCGDSFVPTHNSTTAVILALWFVTTRPRARVVMTSASYRQVRDILWKELRRIVGASPIPIGGKLATDPETGLQIADGREIVGLSTNEPERIAGYSGPEMLFILDEASGIDEAVFEALEGNRAGGARIVLFSNPTQTSGTFFDAFHSKSEFWITIHVSSEETPNVTGAEEPIPGLATLEWVEEKRREWGEESALYAVRVRGDFPTQGDKAVVPLAFVLQAVARWDDEPEDQGALVLGVDVARFGDDESVIVPRRGNRVWPARVLTQLDGPNLAGEVLAVVRELRQLGEKPAVNVDVIGVGASAFDVLARSDEVQAHAVNVAEKATAEGYHSLRDQLWGATRDWLKGGGAIPDDARLQAELVSPVYAFDAQGRMQVESKQAMKKRLNRSPDRADALALAIYQPPSRGYAGFV